MELISDVETYYLILGILLGTVLGISGNLVVTMFFRRLDNIEFTFTEKILYRMSVFFMLSLALAVTVFSLWGILDIFL